MINECDQPTPPAGVVGAAESSIRTVYLGLGSNLGDREANLREAVEQIKALGLNVTRTSSVYETEPVGYKDQPWFLNQVIEAKYAPGRTFDAGWSGSTLEAEELLRALLGIEREMGRERTIPGGPRVIDIDLLIYSHMDGLIARTTGDPSNGNVDAPGGMIVPHPRMHLRRFVLQPLCEIAPDLLHPIYKKTCRDMLATLDDPAIVRVYDARK